MIKRNSPPNYKKESVTRQRRAPLSWRYGLPFLVCGVLLLAGFFFAARQHFSAIEYGIRNAKLRQQKNVLENEQRQLHLDREISFSPAEIKKVAKKIGLQELASNGVEAVKTKFAAVSSMSEKTVGEKIKQAFSNNASPAAGRQTKPNAALKETKNVPGDTRQTAKKPDAKNESREVGR